MTPEEGREQQSPRAELLADARAALELAPEEVDRAHRRFIARLDADEQRGAWRGTTELLPLFRSIARVLLLGTIGVAIISLGWWRCPLYELSVADPPDEIRKKDE